MKRERQPAETPRRPTPSLLGRQRRREGFQEEHITFALVVIGIVWILGSILLISYRPSSLSTQDFALQQVVASPDNLFFRKKQLQRGQHQHSYLKIYESPLLIFTCHRPDYLDKTLGRILEVLKRHPNGCLMGCPIVISQDGHDEKIVSMVQNYQTKFAAMDVPVVHVQHASKNHHQEQYEAYYKLAEHYGWALSKLFASVIYQEGHSYFDDAWPLPQRVVILEEDILIAPDFFHYFQATCQLLDSDSTLFAVSAFDDNGLQGKVKDASRILRSDFFPGLGWMMNRRLWTEELQSKWPDGFWDDWLREPAQRQSRQVLRPEVSRTFHFGAKGGASANQFGYKLSHIYLDRDYKSWDPQQLAKDLGPETFEESYTSLVSQAYLCSSVKQAMEMAKLQNVKLVYRNLRQYASDAKFLGIMTDEKAGVPRSSYKGIVETRPHGDYFLFLVPA